MKKTVFLSIVILAANVFAATTEISGSFLDRKNGADSNPTSINNIVTISENNGVYSLSGLNPADSVCKYEVGAFIKKVSRPYLFSNVSQLQFKLTSTTCPTSNPRFLVLVDFSVNSDGRMNSVQIETAQQANSAARRTLIFSN